MAMTATLRQSDGRDQRSRCLRIRATRELFLEAQLRLRTRSALLHNKTSCILRTYVLWKHPRSFVVLACCDVDAVVRLPLSLILPKETERIEAEFDRPHLLHKRTSHNNNNHKKQVEKDDWMEERERSVG
jgi:hypothetical protein